MPSDDQELARRSRVSTSYDGAVQWRFDWRPGFAIPDRFTAAIAGDWLPCRVQLDLAVNGSELHCVALSLESPEDGAPVTARGLREVPLGECIRLAAAAALCPMERKPGEVKIKLGGPSDMTEPMELASRRPQRRISDDWLREAASIYQAATENPTQAVERQHSQAPISYSTASRWVEEARRRGFLPPTTRGRGGTPTASTAP